jgi:hypothetical protein
MEICLVGFNPAEYVCAVKFCVCFVTFDNGTYMLRIILCREQSRLPKLVHTRLFEHILFLLFYWCMHAIFNSFGHEYTLQLLNS